MNPITNDEVPDVLGETRRGTSEAEEGSVERSPRVPICSTR